MEERLRPLSERECYDRLYGERNPLVTVLVPSAPAAFSAEWVRQAFLARLEQRDPLADVEAEAA